MTEIEFIEAVARCAQILPKTCTLSKDAPENQGLHHKFEWIINEIKNTQCSEEIKSQFPDEGSIFDDLDEEDWVNH